jgi:hypothetical protein
MGNNTLSEFESFYDDGPIGNPTAQIMNQIAQNVHFENHADGSQTFAWVASTGIVSASASLAPAIFIHCGVNDVAANRTWSSIEADLDTIKAAVRSDQTLVMDEILPWTAADDTKAALIRTYNTNLAVWATANDVILILCHDTMGQIRVSTGELDDLKTAYNKGDGIHLSQAGVDTMAVFWSDVITSNFSTILGTQLHPTKAGSNGSDVYLVHQAWPGAAQEVLLGDFCVGTVGSHNYYFECTTAGTSGGSEPTWTDSGTVIDNTVVWTFVGRYSNMGAGYLPHILNDARTFTVTPETGKFLRLRFADTSSQTYLSSGTVAIAYDGNDLTWTDGTNTMTHTVSMVVGDQASVEEATGKLYYNGSLVDTNGSYLPSWGEITLGKATDYRFDNSLDPTDLTWSE